MRFLDRLLDMFKLESTKETEQNAEVPKDTDIESPDKNVAPPMSVYNLERSPTFEITVYFKDGVMYKVEPSDVENWYDARYLISDSILYDLENVDDINHIPVPNFPFPYNVMDGYGVTGSLDYVLRMKAGKLYNRKEKEKCSACLWKSTQMMFANSSMSWRKSDYTRLIRWHAELEMHNEVNKSIDYLAKNGIPFTSIELSEMIAPVKGRKKGNSNSRKKRPEKVDNITYAEKELIIVQNTTKEDMFPYDGKPFHCNTSVKKFIKDGGHPFAYMDIVGENIEVVKREIDKINTCIKRDSMIHESIPSTLSINFDKLVFYSKDYGYTRIMCTPKTYTGKHAKYPFSLNFCTDFSNHNVSTHGELIYGANGDIAKANIYFWNNHKKVFLYYKIVEGIFSLYSIET